MADNLGFGSNPYLGQNNPYLQQNIDATLGDVSRNYQLATAPQMASQNVASGSFGNSGLQQIQNEQQRNLAQTMGNTAANMRMQDYGNQQQMYQWDQGFNRNLYNDANAQNQQNLQNYMGLLSTGNQFNQQDVTNAGNIQNTPMNYYSQFNQQAQGLGGMGGNQTSQTTGTGSPLIGALGGWQLGKAMSNPGLSNDAIWKQINGG